MFGVLRMGFPRHDRSPMPWSSVRTKMMLGRVPSRGFGAAGAVVDARKQRVMARMVDFNVTGDFMLVLFVLESIDVGSLRIGHC